MLMKKGKKWALSCVAISAVVLTGMSANNVKADEVSNSTDSAATTQSAGNQNSDNVDSREETNGQVSQQNALQNKNQQAENTSDSSQESSTSVSDSQEGAVQEKDDGTNNTTESNATTYSVNTTVPSGGKVEDDLSKDDKNIQNNELGYASYFHIFAREAQLNSHTNGNVAVQYLDGNVNFGTNTTEGLLNKDISYIQNIKNIANSSFVSSGDTRDNKVVFGKDADIDISNPNRPLVDGYYMDHLLSSEVYQDQDGEYYIDFDKYFNDLENKSTELSNKEAQMTIKNSDFPDFNQRVIDLSEFEPDENNQIVLNFDSEVLNTGTPITIYGLSKDAGGTNIIINVDTEGQDVYNINSQIKLIYSDGKGKVPEERPNQETEYFDDNHLLWNFYDSTSDDNLYSGTVSVDSPFQGSVLAPKGTIIANRNLDGNIIADKVVVNAETHRWDFQDNSKEETEYQNFVTLPAEGVTPPNGGTDPEGPDENNNNGNEGNEGTDPEEPDENNNNGNEGNEGTDPEEPDENNNNGNEGNEGTDPEEPDENNNNGNEGNEGTDPEEPDENTDNGNEGNTGEPDTDKDDEDEEDSESGEETGSENEDNDSEETDSEENNGGNIITNGGSEGNSEDSNDSSELGEGVLPDVVGSDKNESQTPANDTSDNAAKLPQTGATSGILATISGILLIVLGFLLKGIKPRKD
jgi:LPXTG-motif cell wall-anchored protein